MIAHPAPLLDEEMPVSQPAVYLTSKDARLIRVLSDTPMTVQEMAARAGFGLCVTRRLADRLVSIGVATEHMGGRYSTPTERQSVIELSSKYDVREDRYSVLHGHAKDRLSALPAKSVDAWVMSPPFYKERDYGVNGQIGWEPDPEDYVDSLLDVLAQVSRITRDHGLAFFNIADHRPGGGEAPSGVDSLITLGVKSVGLEQWAEVIWHKTCSIPNGTDRSLNHVFEKMLIFRPISGKHYWDALAARQDAKHGGRRRLTDIWSISPAPHPAAKGKHWATFPMELVRRCLEIGASAGGYCSTCGAPREQVIRRGVTSWQVHGSPTAQGIKRRGGKTHNGNVLLRNGGTTNFVPATMESAGWRPTCDHDAETRMAVVGDPFCGSGTTGLVALEMGHSFVGVDLNPESVGLAATAMRGLLHENAAMTTAKLRAPEMSA